MFYMVGIVNIYIVSIIILTTACCLLLLPIPYPLFPIPGRRGFFRGADVTRGPDRNGDVAGGLD